MPSQHLPRASEKLTVKRWRKRLGLSQLALAERLSRLGARILEEPVTVTQGEISRVERGGIPRPELVVLIHCMSHGQIDANALYELPDWRVHKAAVLELCPGGEG